MKIRLIFGETRVECLGRKFNAKMKKNKDLLEQIRIYNETVWTPLEEFLSEYSPIFDYMDMTRPKKTETYYSIFIEAGINYGLLNILEKLQVSSWSGKTYSDRKPIVSTIDYSFTI